MRIKIMSNYDVWKNFIKIIENCPTSTTQVEKITQNTPKIKTQTLIKDSFIKSKDCK